MPTKLGQIAISFDDWAPRIKEAITGKSISTMEGFLFIEAFLFNDMLPVFKKNSSMRLSSDLEGCSKDLND